MTSKTIRCCFLADFVIACMHSMQPQTRVAFARRRRRQDVKEFDYYPHAPQKHYKMYDSSFPDSQPPLTRKKKKMNNRMLPSMMPSVFVFPSSIPFNPLEEPSPLGLIIRKTPSLLNLITIQLTQNTSSAPAFDALSCESLDLLSIRTVEKWWQSWEVFVGPSSWICGNTWQVENIQFFSIHT